MYAAIGRRVKQLRIDQKLTQEQLAEASGISPSFLGHIERGTRKASIETIYKLMNALDCTANDLLGTYHQDLSSKLSNRLMEIAFLLKTQDK